MNWFNILKNQIASTSAGSFELDFNQPMVEQEEEKCKQKLIKLYEKFQNNWDSISKPLVEKLKTNRVRRLRDRHMVNDLSSVPEEVCCEVIRLWNELQYGTTEVTVNGHYITLYKQVSGLDSVANNYVNVYTEIMIERNNFYKEVYGVGFDVRTDKVTKETDEFIDILEDWIGREMRL